MKYINYDQFNNARAEVKCIVANQVFRFLKTEDDFKKNIETLDKKEIALDKIRATMNEIKEICSTNGYGAAYLKALETTEHCCCMIKDSNVNIRDLMIITAICNNVIAEIGHENMTEYCLVNILLEIDEILKYPKIISVSDTSHY